MHPIGLADKKGQESPDTLGAVPTSGPRPVTAPRLAKPRSALMGPLRKPIYTDPVLVKRL